MISNTRLDYKGNLHPSKIISFRKEENYVSFLTDNNVEIIITILQDNLIRFRYNIQETPQKDFSYAISDKFIPSFRLFEINEEESCFLIQTSQLKCYVQKEDTRIRLENTDGVIILEETLGFHWQESYELGNNIVKMSKKTQETENFYGMGDKAIRMNLKGKKVENFPTDQYAFSKEQEPLYKAIPFYIGLQNNISYGIFFDNSFRSYFDFCLTERNVTSFWAEGGEMNYYFFYGPKMQSVVAAYSYLIGVPKLPPLWALGYHQAKFSYYPEEKVRNIANKFRELKIPCDSIHLDIDYMDGFKNFTWNEKYFPNPKEMISDLLRDGFKTIVIIDPGIKIDNSYWVYQEGIANDYFCKRADGPYVKGKVWPGDCNFPDFTSPKVREWWGGLFKELISETGVRGIWTDMNEPAIMEVDNKTFPPDVRHDYDGNPCSHRKAHNIYGSQMARATLHGVRRFLHPKRPLVITRSAYPGAQRYAASWTGDNVSSWEHLWIANVQMQRMSLSGMGFSGTDIGGFVDPSTGELYVRWLQLGVFHPFCRTHFSGAHGDQEPWAFGEEATEIIRKFVNLRYQLLPYLYTMFWKYITDGEPLLKPLVFFDQEDPQTHNRNDEFIFGSQILVCPILEPNSIGRRMYIPRGKWYNYWSKTLISGGGECWVDAKFENIPLFIKEGAIIPKYPVQQYVGELDFDELVLEVYYKNGKEKSYIFEDAHDGYDYTKGDFSYLNLINTGKENEISIQLHKEGRYETKYTKYRIEFIGLLFDIHRIELNNEEFHFNKEDFNKNQTLVIDKEFEEIRLLGI